jgi:hypothetical protein
MKQPDNTAFLRAAAQERSLQTRSKAEATLRAAQTTNGPVTFAGIARSAGVSRSWLYTQSDLVNTIDQLRGRAHSPKRTGQQPASDASLKRRLETALHRLKELRATNADLTRRLEAAHAEIRRLRTDDP